MSHSQTITSDPRWVSTRDAPATQASLTTNPEGKKKQRTYFKLAKALQVLEKLGEEESLMAEAVMKRTQFERKKDLSNIRHNNHS